MKQKSMAWGSGLLLIAAILVWADRSGRSSGSQAGEQVSEISDQGAGTRPPSPERESPRVAKTEDEGELAPRDAVAETSEPAAAQAIDADAAFLEEVMKLPPEMRLLAVEREAERRMKEYERNNAKVLKEGVIDRGKLFSYVVPRASSEEIKAMYAPFEKYRNTLTDKGDRLKVEREMESFHRSENPANGESKLLIAVVSDAKGQVQYASIPISNHENALEIMEEEVHPPVMPVGVPYTPRDGTRGLLKNATTARPWRMDHFVPQEDLVNIRHPHGKLR
jgi:hypothetical protein